MRKGFATASSFAARTLFVGMLSLFGALGALGARAADGPPDEEGYNLLIEGQLPEAVRLHVRIDDSKDALRFR